MKISKITALGSMVVLLFLAGSCGNQQSINAEETSPYQVNSLEIPGNMIFAGEQVPLGLYYVKESLDRELLVNTFWHSSTILQLKRANRFFPVIEPILKAHNIPDDFKYIAMIESGLDQVVSPSGATGFWQFMEGTAKDYNLEVNDEVDERYHIEKSTEAACKYFRDAYEEFGNWTLAAASYNVGKRGISKQIERQGETDYYKLLLNDETERYVFRILAMKEIHNNPGKYGFHIEEDHLYKPIDFQWVKVDSAVSIWAGFAKKYGLNYRILKEFNPWLRESYLKNKQKKTYFIKIPDKEDIYE